MGKKQELTDPEKFNKLIGKAKLILGEDTDFMIITHTKNGMLGAATHGNTEELAQSLFANIHNTAEAVGQTLYRILKLNVMNIFNNPSCYAQDLMMSINNVLNKDNGDESGNE